MPKRNTPILNNFTGGELSPLMKGRVDFDKYQTGLLEMENMIVYPHGGVTKRPGFEFMAQTGGQDDWSWGTHWAVSRLIPYRFYKSPKYTAGNAAEEVINCVLEFGNQKMVAYEDGVLVTYLGEPVEWTIPWSHDFLEDLRWVQYGNSIIFVHPKYQPQRFYRDPGASISTRYKYTNFQHERGPFRPRNENEAYLINVDAVTGSTHMNHPYMGAVTSGITNAVFKIDHKADFDGDTVSQTFNANMIEDESQTITTTGRFGWLHVDVGQYIVYQVTGTWTGTLHLEWCANQDYSDDTDWGHKVNLYSTNAAVTSIGPIGSFRIARWHCSSLTSGTINATLKCFAGGVGNPISIGAGESVKLTGTSGWTGEIKVERSWDNGANWSEWESYTSTTGTTTISATLNNNLTQRVLVRWNAILLLTGSIDTTITQQTHEAGSGTLKVDAYHGSGTWDVTIEEDKDRDDDDEYGIHSTATTWRWWEGCWSGERGWPSQVAFFEDRLVLAANPEYPNRIWMSKTGDYTNFEATGEDDGAIDITLNSDGMEHILWMRSEKYLIVGTNEGEWKVGAAESTDAVTPSNVSAKMQTNYGSADVPAVKAGKSLIFLNETGRRIHELTSDWELDGYIAEDLALMAEHVGVGGFKRIAYQRDPHRILWFLRNDGVLCGLTYLPEQKVFAWHRHTTRTSEAQSAIKDLITIPGTSGDEVWIIVERKLKSSSNPWPYVERMGPFYDGTNADKCTWLDCSSYVNKTSGTTVDVDQLRGWALPNYTGEVVTYIYAANGSQTTLAGWQTQGTATCWDGGGDGAPWFYDIGVSANIHVWSGLPYTGKIKTMPIEIESTNGMSMGQDKDIGRLVLRVLHSFNTMSVGRDSTDAEQFSLPQAYDYTGDVVIDEIPAGNGSEATLYVAVQGAGPFTLLALMPSISVSKP